MEEAKRSEEPGEAQGLERTEESGGLKQAKMGEETELASECAGNLVEEMQVAQREQRKQGREDTEKTECISEGGGIGGNAWGKRFKGDRGGRWTGVCRRIKMGRGHRQRGQGRQRGGGGGQRG
jgi:hypothetical protein